jgi:hypothetical protein
MARSLNIFTIHLFGAQTNGLHTCWMAKTLGVLLPVGRTLVLLLSDSIPGFLAESSLLARLSSSFAQMPRSGCCAICDTVQAALNRDHKTPHADPYATVPISRYSACRSCSWWNAPDDIGFGIQLHGFLAETVFISRLIS